MGWARLDDGYAMHPKLVQAGLEATGLDARAISHCAKYETDGFVADAEVSMLAGDAKRGAVLAKRLAAVNRWERDNEREGYWVHDYLDYNKSHEQLESERKTDRSRKNSGRNPPGKPPESRRSPPGHPPESGGNPNGIRPDASHARPVRAGGSASARPPSRPVLDKHLSSSSLQVVGEGAEEEELGVVEKALLAIGTAKLGRRLHKLDLEPVTDPEAWLRRAIDRDREAFGAEMATMAEQGADVDLLVRTFDRQPEPPNAEAGPSREHVPCPLDEVWDAKAQAFVMVRRGA